MTEEKGRGLRVLMLSQRMPPHIAGAELQAIGLARALTDLGVQVKVVTTKFAPGLSSCEEIDGIEVRRLPVLRGRHGQRANSAAVQASQLLAAAIYTAARARYFDVVHAHCVSATSLGAILGAKIAGRPVIVKPSLGGEGGEIRKITGSAASKIALPLLRRADLFATLDDQIASELIDAGVARDRLVAVDNGIDLSRFYPASDGEREELRVRLGLRRGPLALFVGQIIERKGVRQLLEAWRLVARSLPGATLVFAGEGADAEAVARDAARSGSGVLLLGPRDDVPELMRAANLLAVPSRNESFGNVFVEAMACGLPIIYGPSGVGHRLGLDRVAGRAVDPDAPEAIASVLCEILGSPEQARALGERGVAIARQFDFRLVARRYVTIYESMMRERHK